MGKSSTIFSKIREKFRDFGRLTPIALVTALLPIAGSSVLVAVGYPLGNWLRENWEPGSILFLLGVLVFCGLALLPTNLVGILGGWAFGFWMGMPLLIVGVVSSAVISFYINKRLAGDTFTALTQQSPRAEVIHKALTNEGFFRTTLVITLIRLSVVMPFAFTNFFLAAARVPLGSFLVGTFVGMLPRSGTMVFLGSGLSVLTFEEFDDFWLLAAGILATVLLMIVIGVFSRRALNQLTPDNSERFN